MEGSDMHARSDFVTGSLITGWFPGRLREVVKVGISRDVTLGDIITAAAILGGVALYQVNNVGKAQQALDAVQSLRVDMTANVQALRVDMKESFVHVQSDIGGVRGDIANLPDVRAELVQMERRVDQIDSRADAQSKRLEILEREVIQMRSDVDHIVPSTVGQVRQPVH